MNLIDVDAGLPEVCDMDDETKNEEFGFDLVNDDSLQHQNLFVLTDKSMGRSNRPQSGMFGFAGDAIVSFAQPNDQIEENDIIATEEDLLFIQQ